MTTPATSASAYLVYELERRAYPIADKCTIGRDTSNDIVIGEPTVSRTHASVTRDAGVLMLDTGGATGARVNGTAVAGRQPLTAGDRIEIGTAVLTVRQPPLPVGVSIVDRIHGPSSDPIAAKRATIRSPLLSGKPEAPKTHPIWRGVLLLILLIVLTAVLLR